MLPLQEKEWVLRKELHFLLFRKDQLHQVVPATDPFELAFQDFFFFFKGFFDGLRLVGNFTVRITSASLTIVPVSAGCSSTTHQSTDRAPTKKLWAGADDDTVLATRDKTVLNLGQILARREQKDAPLDTRLQISRRVEKLATDHFPKLEYGNHSLPVHLR